MTKQRPPRSPQQQDAMPKREARTPMNEMAKPTVDDRGRVLRRKYLMHAPVTDEHGNQILVYRDLSYQGRISAPSHGTLAHPLLSIVIPAYGNEALLRQCLTSIRTTIRWECWEAIVVDDHKEGEPISDSAVAPHKLIRMPVRGGFAKACNEGSRHARGRYLVFLNTDCVCLPGWAEAMLRWFKRLPRQVGAVAPLALYPTGLVQHAGMRPEPSGTFVHEPKMFHPPSAEEEGWEWVPAASGACLAIPTALFHSLGGFSEQYALGYFEDVDLCLRLADRGLGTLLDPQGRIVHYEGQSFGNEQYEAIERAGVAFRAQWPAERVAAVLAKPEAVRASPKPLASVIVTVHNAARVTRRCLVSLAQHTHYRPIEVVLADDGSDAHTVALLDDAQRDLEAGGVRVVRLRNDPAIGYLKNSNRAFDATTGEYVCLLNSDIILSPWWLSKMIAAFEDDPDAMICNPVISEGGANSVPLWRGRDAETQAAEFEFAALPTRHRVATCVGSCILFRREALQRFRYPAGVFDDYYDPGYGEETDLCMRVYEAGKKCIITDDTYVFHEGHSSFLQAGVENMKKHSDAGLRKFFARWKTRYDEAAAMERRVDSIGKIRAFSRACVSPARDWRPAMTTYLHSTMICGGTLACTQISERMSLLFGWRTAIATSAATDWAQHPYASQPLIYAGESDFIDGFRRDPDAPAHGIVVATLACTPAWVIAAARGGPFVPVYFVQGDELNFRDADGNPSFDPQMVMAGYAAIPNRICNSTWIASLLKERGFDSVVIPVGFDPDVFYPRRKASCADGRLTVCCGIAPGTPMHGHGTWIKVVDRLRERFGERIDIVCYGYPPFGNERPRYRYVGKLPPAQVGALLAAADVAVDPSVSQGFGLPGLEAMASGTALVLTDSGGPRQYAENEVNCRMVPVGNDEAIARNIVDLLERHDERARLVAGGLRTAAGYTWDKIAAQWDRQLRAWLAQRSTTAS